MICPSMAFNGFYASANCIVNDDDNDGVVLGSYSFKYLRHTSNRCGDLRSASRFNPTLFCQVRKPTSRKAFSSVALSGCCPAWARKTWLPAGAEAEDVSQQE